MADKNPDANSTSISIGNEIKIVGLSVSGKLFVFTPYQMQFLLNLQKLKNVHAAAISIQRDEEWAKKFLASRKFKDYLSCKMQEYSVKNGLTVEWWYQFGKCLTDGYKEIYEVHCLSCDFSGTMNTYEVETQRNDDMQLEVTCPSCYKPMNTEYVKQPFNPTREQVEGWKDLGARLIPKVERVHHQFENVNISFENEAA
jgi:hypothetical protein